MHQRMQPVFLVQQRANEQRLVVLTTHSMEEAEAVCNNISMIVGGRMTCLGSQLYLKQRFGKGYRLIVRSASFGVEEYAQSQSDRMTSFVNSVFPHSFLLDSVVGQRIYEVGHIASLSHAFAQLEQNRTALQINTYALQQNSLEQVFMHFAKQAEVEAQQRAVPNFES